MGYAQASVPERERERAAVFLGDLESLLRVSKRSGRIIGPVGQVPVDAVDPSSDLVLASPARQLERPLQLGEAFRDPSHRGQDPGRTPSQRPLTRGEAKEIRPVSGIVAEHVCNMIAMLQGFGEIGQQGAHIDESPGIGRCQFRIARCLGQGDRLPTGLDGFPDRTSATLN
jgi:hypothetical protein